MDLFTRVDIPPLPTEISYKSRLFFMGSCFSHYIGERFSRARFETTVNPFGVLFNPFSVFDSLERIARGGLFTEEDWIESDSGWINLSLHGQFAFQSRDEALREVNNLILTQRETLKNTSHFFITLGTAFAFRHNDTGRICANCHRIPQQQFTRFLLSPEEITAHALRVLDKLQALNPDIQIIFTVSPVRHIRQGAFQNNVSKGTLFLALQSLLQRPGCSYFPAYELIMDELRDYRYYDRDLVHPNTLAVDYIWERMTESCFSAETKSLLKHVQAIVSDMEHRPLHPQSEAYCKFQAALDKKIEVLASLAPYLRIKG